MLNICKINIAIVGLWTICSLAQAHDVNDKPEMANAQWETADNQYGQLSQTSDGTESQINMKSIHIVGDGTLRTATISEMDSRPRLQADGTYVQQARFKSVVVGCVGDPYSHSYQVTGLILANIKPFKLVENRFWGYDRESSKSATYGTVQYLLSEKICAQ